MDNIDYLPVWKKDASPEERFLELAMIARKHPERFGSFIVIYQEAVTVDGIPGAQFSTEYHTYGVNTLGAIALIEIGKFSLLRYVHNVS